MLDVVRHPRDLFVVGQHLVFDLGDLDEPRTHSLVDERVFTAPAVRVGVVVGFVTYQNGAVPHRPCFAVLFGGVLELSDQRRVSFEHLQACEFLHWRGELAARAHGHDGFDSGSLGDNVVVLTERSRGVNQSGTVRGGDEVPFEDPEGVFVAFVVGERRVVGVAQKVGAFQRFNNRRVLPQFLCVRCEASLSDHVPFSGTGWHLGLHNHVVDVRAHHDRKVRRKGPRRGGPDQEFSAVQTFEWATRACQANGDRRVLAVLVDLFVHAEFVV